MSTAQVSKPRSPNQSITEECGRPGTLRSKVGWPAIDEPCTKRIVPFDLPTAGFSQRKRRTSPAAVLLLIQCSLPFMNRTVADFVQESAGLSTDEEASMAPDIGTLDTFPKLLMHHARVRP